MDEDVLCGWTIYANTSDFPRHFAVRMWWVEDVTVVHHPIAVLCDTLDEAREQVPAGAFCVGREAADDPVIVETWL